jgi:hypothetical protein
MKGAIALTDNALVSVNCLNKTRAGFGIMHRLGAQNR